MTWEDITTEYIMFM